MESSNRERLFPQRAERDSCGYVLIVGSDAEFLEYYRHIFSALGLISLSVPTNEAALACLRLLVFDFVVVEQGGRDTEGRCILERVKELNHRTSVLIITQCPDAECCLKATELGTAEYLPHQVTIAEMARKVGSPFRGVTGVSFASGNENSSGEFA